MTIVQFDDKRIFFKQNQLKQRKNIYNAQKTIIIVFLKQAMKKILRLLCCTALASIVLNFSNANADEQKSCGFQIDGENMYFDTIKKTIMYETVTSAKIFHKDGSVSPLDFPAGVEVSVDSLRKQQRKACEEKGCNDNNAN